MSQLTIFRSNRQFQTIALSQMLTTFGSNLLIPVLPVYLKLQGFSDTKIGILMGVTALGALVIRPWCGKMVDKRGSRPVLLFGQTLTAFGVMAYFWASSFLPLLFLRFFQGIALAFYGTASVTFASSVETPEKTAGAIALYTVFTMVGMSIATSSAPFIFDSMGFHSLVGLGLITTLSAFWVMISRGKTIPPVAGGKRAPFLTVLRTKEVLAPTVCLFASKFFLYHGVYVCSADCFVDVHLVFPGSSSGLWWRLSVPDFLSINSFPASEQWLWRQAQVC